MTKPSASLPSPLTLDAIRAGGKRAVARILNLIEMKDGDEAVAQLLDKAAEAAQAHVVGLTGPPGVGKSTLTNSLIKEWRLQGESVGVIAVDPSSRISQGALLGDRTRLDTDPADKNVFVRSMAARDRLGGLSHEAVSAIIMMRALYDHVLVESVGIGQSEADIAFAADTVILCIQPGSGDSLQFMKAGIMEVPDIVVVTKSDTGSPARRAKADVEGALSLALCKQEGWIIPVLMASATTGKGIGQLMESVRAHQKYMLGSGRLYSMRQEQARLWLEERIRYKFGKIGLEQMNIEGFLGEASGPFSAERAITIALSEKLAGN